MTVIESHCSGTPLLVANHKSMNTLAGDAGHYFRPEDPHDLARAFLELRVDENLYQKLQHHTHTLRKTFDGEQVTSMHEELYYSALGLDT